MATSVKPTSKGKVLTIEDAVCLVVQQGLTPDMAIRACNNEDITSSVLSRKISAAVDEAAKKEVALIREKQKEDGSDSSHVIGTDDRPATTSSSSNKRRRTSRTSIDSTASTGTASSSSLVAPTKKPGFGNVLFEAPYLKRGPTHFQRKFQKRVEQLLKEKEAYSSPKKIPKKATTLRIRKTSLQKNKEWRNDIAYNEDAGERYKTAFKEATQKFADLQSGKLTGTTQQKIVDELNRKYTLDGEGREGSREKHILIVRTVARAVSKGIIGASPKKKGRKSTISRDFLRLTALHVNMEQVGDKGELDTAQIQATMLAAMLGTVHEDEFNNKYAWEVCRRENADILVPTGVVQSDDIRWQWVTYEKLDQFFTDLKGVYLKYGFAIDEKQQLPDGSFAEITMQPLLAGRHIVFDETEIRLGNDRDAGGTRAGTYTNTSLNRGGARSTRSSHHVTAGIAVTAAGEVLPPLFIFSSSAEYEANFAVNDAWIASLGLTRGKYGHKEYIERLPYIAVRKSGSMDIRLIMQFIEEMTFDLYPRETVSLEIKIDEHGRLVCGPVFWGMDTGPGRLAGIDSEFAEEWEEWAKSKMQQGIIMCGLLPNSTSVSAVMDELYRAFKIATRSGAQKVYAKKIKKNAKQIAAKKIANAKKLANGEELTASDKAKVNVVVTLNPADLGDILYGELDNKGYGSPTSPFERSFTKEKILEAHEKLGFYPFTRKLLQNPKVRHEIGQGEETGQTRQMRDLEKEYSDLKERCHDQGFDTTVFDAVLPTTSPIIRGETVEERARALAKTGKTASAGGMFRCLGSMLYNGEELMLARKIQREMREKEEQDQLDKEQAEMEKIFEEADQVYQKFKEKKCKLDKLGNDDLKKLVKYICKIENKPKDAPSHHKNATLMKERLAKVKVKPSWTKYFEPVEDSDDEGSTAAAQDVSSDAGEDC